MPPLMKTSPSFTIALQNRGMQGLIEEVSAATAECPSSPAKEHFSDRGKDEVIHEETTASHPPSPDTAGSATDSLIRSLMEELSAAKEEIARLTKERAYFKRKAEWCTIEDQRILSPVITSTDHWQERTWLLLHEPIRSALLDFEELVASPSFDPVQYPWKVTNFFYFFNTAFAPYVRRHHQVEQKIYIPWVAGKTEIPDEVRGGYDGIEELIQEVEASEAEYKSLERAIRKGKIPPASVETSVVRSDTSAPSTLGPLSQGHEDIKAKNREKAPDEEGGPSSAPASLPATSLASAPAPSPKNTPLSSRSLYDWRRRLIARLDRLSHHLIVHMDQEESFFPPAVLRYFSQHEEERILEQMSSASAAHLELPMVLLAMDVWGSPDTKAAFLKKLSRAARYTLNTYWLSSYKKSVARSLESLALQEPPPTVYLPHMSVNQLLVAAPVFLLCTIS